MDEQAILQQVHQLVEQEHTLRAQVEDGTISADEENARLQRLEEALDQCWDLLRQRRARRDAGQDADAAAVRPADEVEGYLQ